VIDLETGPAETFEAATAPLFEGAPRFLARLAAARPFTSTADLFARARAIVHAMPETDQVELLDAHPRLGAPPGSVSALSFVEQGYDRETAGEAAEIERARVAAELERLNAAYEDRYGFRYCVFVAGRPRATLVPEFEAAINRPRDEELHRALDAVVDIAIDRHAKLLREAAR
jgi:2-oxo-4-hydroxy-4-carboxy--5-ureidoimidazoline (OHCU) decarboxylase